MKTKFKDFLLYIMACIGAISLFISSSSFQKESDNSKYAFQAVVGSGGGIYTYFVLDTETGVVYYWGNMKEGKKVAKSRRGLEKEWLKMTTPIEQN